VAVQVELNGWRDSLRLRQSALDPHEDAFKAAHERVAQALRLYPMHVGNPVIKAGYDGRMAAGVARNPFRQAVREADRMVRVLTVELRDLIAENAP